IEDAPCLLRIDLIHVDLAGLIDCLADRVLRDFVEKDAADLSGVAAEELHDVPADRLSLAIRVRRDEDRRGFLCGGPQLADDLLFSFENFVCRLEGLFVDAELALGQIANVTDRGFDDVVAADELVDRLRFCGRLDDDEVFGHCGTPQTSTPTPEFLARASCARVREAAEWSEARTIAPRWQDGQKPLRGVDFSPEMVDEARPTNAAGRAGYSSSSSSAPPAALY